MPSDPDPNLDAHNKKIHHADNQHSGSSASFKARLERNLKSFFEDTAYDICIPRNEVVSISSSVTLDEAFLVYKKHLFSRYPVHNQDNHDEILGILSIKDILINILSKKDTLVSELMRPVYFISFSEPVYQVLESMQQKNVKMAVVVNEYGEIDGIVDSETILEVIVGKVNDEYDPNEKLVFEQKEEGLVVSGKFELDDLHSKIGIKFDSDDIETLSGYITYKLGRVPDIGETFDIDKIRITILESDDKKIDLLLLDFL